jgi:hypothetical protein
VLDLGSTGGASISPSTNSTLAGANDRALASCASVMSTPVSIAFKQSVAANETLRAGSYGNTLTFTLSTTTP